MASEIFIQSLYQQFKVIVKLVQLAASHNCMHVLVNNSQQSPLNVTERLVLHFVKFILWVMRFEVKLCNF